MNLLPPVDVPFSGTWGRYPKSGKTHRAVDYPVRVGTAVRCPGDGVVTTSGWSATGFGKHIRIRLDATGDTVILAHGSVLHAGKGKRVARGDIVMASGNSGMSTGPHLHMEVRRSSWLPLTSFDFTGLLSASIAHVKTDAGRPAIRVANVRPGQRNTDVRIFNALLWRSRSAAYKAKHLARWLREPADLFGPVAQQVTHDAYAQLHQLDPRNWGPAPAMPTWPGKALVKHLGGEPR